VLRETGGSTLEAMIDPALARQVKRGEYVVNADAVAGAVLRRWRSDRSAVRVAPKPFEGSSVGVQQDEPGTGRDLA
jgi:hypothetical protein